MVATAGFAWDYLPTGATTIWALVTVGFTSKVCSNSEVGGLGFLVALLGAIVFFQTYASHWYRSEGYTTWLRCTMVATTTTSAFLAIALLTSPGTTCFYPIGGSQLTSTRVTPALAYALLGFAWLVAYCMPQIGGWVETFSETLGPGIPEHHRLPFHVVGTVYYRGPLRVRRRLEREALLQTASYFAEKKKETVLIVADVDEEKGKEAAPPAQAAVAPAGDPEAAAAPLDFESINLDLKKSSFKLTTLNLTTVFPDYLYQHLPTMTVTCYLLITAYWTNQTTCTGWEQATLWLLVGTLTVGCFFVSVHDNFGDKEFEVVGDYAGFARITLAFLTAGTFAALAVLAPPGSTCMLKAGWYGFEPSTGFRAISVLILTLALIFLPLIGFIRFVFSKEE